MDKRQTAVEWLIEQYGHSIHTIQINEQAKAMEKEQHFELYKLGNSFLDSDNLNFKDYFEQYYNETYGK